MIIVKICGGLGNQMFQYALGRSLSYKHKTSLKLDINWFKDVDKNYVYYREFCLNKFNIFGEIATKEDLKTLGITHYPGIKGKIWKRLEKIPGLKNNKKVIEEIKGFDQSIMKLPDSVYLEGHWISYKYFEEIKDLLIKDFSLKVKLESEILRDITNSNSVSIHVRQKDYRGYELDVSYYRKAISIIKNKIKNPLFFIFSDDKEWAKKNLGPICNGFLISDLNFEDYQELILMSKCKHNIIANSTFSWWGAYLNVFPNKIVVSPVDKSLNKDFLLPDWIKV